MFFWKCGLADDQMGYHYSLVTAARFQSSAFVPHAVVSPLFARDMFQDPQ